MKNKAIISIIFCIALALFSNELYLSYAAPLTEARKAEINEDFKGLWVATITHSKRRRTVRRLKMKRLESSKKLMQWD